MYGTKRALTMATWTQPQCPFVIEYSPQVMEEIRMAVVSAFHALPHGGLEIGGILMGSSSAERVTITEFRPLACEHAFGPSFRLSESDHERLSTAIAEAQKAELTVVGWFHSHTRTAIFLTDADLEIQNQHFKDPRQIAVVLKPVALKPTLCGFFFREADGSIHSEQSYQEIELVTQAVEGVQAPAVGLQTEGTVLPFPTTAQSRRRMREDGHRVDAAPEVGPTLPSPTHSGAALREHTIADRDQLAVPANPGGENAPELFEPETDLQTESDGWTPPPQKSRGVAGQGAWLLVGVAIVLGLGAAYFAFNRSNHTEAPKQQAAASEQTLGLKIQRQGADLVLTWNRDAHAMLGATAGLLSIKDGAKQKEMGLNSDQLRSANILISPVSDHIEVQLTLLLPNHQTASESGIVILPAPKSTEPVRLAAIAPLKTYTESQIKTEVRKVIPSKAFVAPPDRNRAADSALLEQPPAWRQGGPDVQIQSNTLAAFRTAPNGPPPVPIAAPVAPPAAAPVAEQKRVDPPAKAMATAAVPSPVAAQTTPNPTTPRSPVAALRVGGDAQPAQLISRKDPVYPYAARMGHIHGGVVLAGLIGTDGRVKELAVVSGLQVLRQAAVDAVRQWVYKPATLNGKTIEARVQVEVQFRELL